MHVTKQEFVDRVADKSGLSKRDAGEAVDAFLETITEVLRGRGEVAFTGFGKFATRGPRRTHGRQPEEPVGESADPRDDRPEVLRGQPAQAGSEERRRLDGGGGGDM